MITIIKEVSKKNLKDFLYDINLEDEKIYTEANNKNSIGIFQFSGGTATNLVKKIKPQNFEEMVSINSLARPGTIDFADEYNSNKETGETRYPEKITKILEKTHNVILFQEQVMRIFNEVGGFTLSETNEIRSLMKKLGKADKKKEDLDRWDQVVNIFVENAIKGGIDKNKAKEIASDLLKMSSYSFNRSHSVAYTYTAMMTLYLSVYFKPYFFSSTLKYEATKQNNDLKKRLNDCRAYGFTILPPDINKSKQSFYPDGDSIRFGLSEIKGVSTNTSKIIQEYKPYTSIVDFITKTAGNRIIKTTINGLISGGAFDDLIGKERKKALLIFERFHELKKATTVKEKLFALWDKIEKEVDGIPGLTTSPEDMMNLEKEYFGFSFFTSFFNDKTIPKIYAIKDAGLCSLYLEDLNKFKNSDRVPLVVQGSKIFNDKNGNEMAFLEVVDLSGKETRIPVFQSYWKFIKNGFSGNGLYLLSVYKDENKEDAYMFGSKKWVDDVVKPRLIKKLA